MPLYNRKIWAIRLPVPATSAAGYLARTCYQWRTGAHQVCARVRKGAPAWAPQTRAS